MLALLPCLRLKLGDLDVMHLVNVSLPILDRGVPTYGNSWHMPMARTSG